MPQPVTDWGRLDLQTEVAWTVYANVQTRDWIQPLLYEILQAQGIRL